MNFKIINSHIKKCIIWILVLAVFLFSFNALLLAYPFKARADDTLHPVILNFTTQTKDDKYNVILKWTNTNMNYTGMEPEGAFMLYQVYRDGSKLGNSIMDTHRSSYSYTDTLTKTQINTDHTYYIIVEVTRPAKTSKPSNKVTVTKNDFDNPPPDRPPPAAGEITAPRVVGSVSGTSVALKWDRTKYSDCDPDSGYLGYQVYRDNNKLGLALDRNTTSYTDKLTDQEAKEAHTYYVKTFCTRVSGYTGGKESPPSNTIQYNPPENGQPGSISNPDGVKYDENDIKEEGTEEQPVYCDQFKGVTGSLKIFWNPLGYMVCSLIGAFEAMANWILNQAKLIIEA